MGPRHRLLHRRSYGIYLAQPVTDLVTSLGLPPYTIELLPGT